MKLNRKGLFKKPAGKSAVRNALLRALFSNIGLFIIVTVYAALGAYIIVLLELPEEEKRFDLKRTGADMLTGSKVYIVGQAWSQRQAGEEDFKIMMRDYLNLYRKTLIQKMKNEKYDGEPDNWKYEWTIANSLLFTVTTMGAIGYGNIHPKTWLGQLFVIYYAMIGIPLLLLFLANIGDFMASAMRYIYSRLCCRWCRARRRLADFRNRNMDLHNRALMQDEVGQESYMPTKEISVPIMVNLAVISAYLACGGAFFRYSEDWQLHESCYFCFITLTTIGFGDYVPGRGISSGSNPSVIASLQFLITIVYSIFGMALLSMSINLMKTQIIGNSKWVAYEMGVLEEDFDPRERYQIKMADETGMIITPPGKDGNKQDLLHNAEDDFTLPREQIYNQN